LFFNFYFNGGWKRWREALKPQTLKFTHFSEQIRHPNKKGKNKRGVKNINLPSFLYKMRNEEGREMIGKHLSLTKYQKTHLSTNQKRDGFPKIKLLRSTFYGQWKVQTHHTQPWRSTSAGRWRGKPRWILQSRQSISSREEQPP